MSITTIIKASLAPAAGVLLGPTITSATTPAAAYDTAAAAAAAAADPSASRRPLLAKLLRLHLFLMLRRNDQSRNPDQNYHQDSTTTTTTTNNNNNNYYYYYTTTNTQHQNQHDEGDDDDCYYWYYTTATELLFFTPTVRPTTMTLHSQRVRYTVSCKGNFSANVQAAGGRFHPHRCRRKARHPRLLPQRTSRLPNLRFNCNDDFCEDGRSTIQLQFVKAPADIDRYIHIHTCMHR